jgi:hypothetical protein
VPEDMTPEPDIKKVERKIQSDQKAGAKKWKWLSN